MKIFSLWKVKGDMRHILSRVERCISEEANSYLTAVNTEEVLGALKEMGPIKAPRCYWFSTIFFQKCWHIVGREVSNFCLGVLNNDLNLEPMNVTNIVLIPKIPKLTSMVNFRPSSLCNVIYKLITKVIANRFQKVLDVCIDPAHTAFVPRRLILDNVLLPYEMIHTFG